MTLTMQSTIQLRSGRRMPVLGLGTWQLTRDTPGTVAEALRLGYRLIDTSGDYGTQAAVGEAIRGCGIERAGISFQTKVEEDEDAYAAVGRNLADAGLAYADLILIHRPPRRSAGTTLWKGPAACPRRRPRARRGREQLLDRADGGVGGGNGRASGRQPDRVDAFRVEPRDARVLP